MKAILHISAIATISLLLALGSKLYAQTDGGPVGGRDGFGGGQMRQMSPPVQGIVTAATAETLTLKTGPGDSYIITVSPNTRIMKAGQGIKLSDIKPGDSITAMGTVDTTKKTVQAIMLNDVDAAMLARATENMGKTYITGKITAIDADNLKLTIQRSDNVSQVVALDDGTSFQRGTRGVAIEIAAAGALIGGGGFGGGRGGRQGAAQAALLAPESITLADIKVGDSVMATGTLKAGVFTVLKMGVATPQAPGAGRQRRPDAPALVPDSTSSAPAPAQ